MQCAVCAILKKQIGSDNVVALPTSGRGDEKEVVKENNKSVSSYKNGDEWDFILVWDLIKHEMRLDFDLGITYILGFD